MEVGLAPFHILFNSNRLYLSIVAEKKASLDFHPRAHIKCAALALFCANLIAQECKEKTNLKRFCKFLICFYVTKPCANRVINPELKFMFSKKAAKIDKNPHRRFDPL